MRVKEWGRIVCLFRYSPAGCRDKITDSHFRRQTHLYLHMVLSSVRGVKPSLIDLVLQDNSEIIF